MKTVKSDVVFLNSKGGLPAIVEKTEENSAKIKLNSEKEQIKKYHRHGFINGLTAEDKITFNSILDDIKSSEKTPLNKIDELKDIINEFQKTKGKQKLANYLQAELFHLMRKYRTHPAQYTINEKSIDV